MVWTGTEFVVWGGRTTEADPVARPEVLGDGARFDPAADRWRPVAMDGAPTARSGHKAVWTGRYMAVFGSEIDVFPTQPMQGWLYDPVADAWTAMTTVGAPDPRAYYDVVAVDGRVVVWGGWSMPGAGTVEYPAATGAVYDPADDTWSPITEAGAPRYDGGHTVLAGSGELVTYGATAHFLAPGAGQVLAARYDLASGAWTELGAATGLIGNGQAYAASALVDGRLLSVTATSDSRQCLLLELQADGTFARQVLAEAAGPTAPSCLYVSRQDPLLAAGLLVAHESQRMLDLASRTLLRMPPPPLGSLASVPFSPGLVPGSWEGAAAATDGRSVFLFGGVVRAAEPPPSCPPGAPCLAPQEEARGALGVLLSL